MKICITYIATNGYHVYFPAFYESVRRFFCTKDEITIAVVTDIPEFFRPYDRGVVLYPTEKQQDVNLEKFHKFTRILETKPTWESADYWFFLNANIVFLKPIEFDWITGGKKMTVAKAMWRYKRPFATNTGSEAYFDAHVIPGWCYVNAGLIGATPDLVIQIAENIQRMEHKDRETGMYKYVPWHDETYFNKYLWTEIMRVRPFDVHFIKDSYWLNWTTRELSPDPKFWYTSKKSWRFGRCLEDLLWSRDQCLGTNENNNDNSAIIYESDGRNSEMLGWALFATRRALGHSVKIFVLTNLDEPEFPNANDLASTYGVRFVKVDDKILLDLGIDISKWRSKWPYVVLYRLLAPLLDVFRGFRSIVHLDVDTLIFSKEAANLLHIESNGHEMHAPPDVIGAVPKVLKMRDNKDLMPQEMRTKLEARTWKSGYSWCRSYVNAGVVVLHLNEIGRDISWYKERLACGFDGLMKGKFHFNDQDIINLFFDVGMLSPMYDKIGNRSGVNWEDTIIHHYAGGRKQSMLADAQKYLGYPAQETGTEQESKQEPVRAPPPITPTIPDLPCFTVDI